MRTVNERERREADLFLADLMGGPRPMRTDRQRVAPHPFESMVEQAETIGAESADESILETAVDPARVFDEVVYRGADPTPLMGVDDDPREWEVVGLPSSATSPEMFRDGQLVVRRSLGEGRLAVLQVLGEDVQIADLYGTGLRLRNDVLVLGRTAAAPVADDRAFESLEGEGADEFAETTIIENIDMLRPIPVESGETEDGEAEDGESDDIESEHDEADTSERDDGEWERAETGDIADTIKLLERVERFDNEDIEDVEQVTTGVRTGVTIQAAPGLGTSRTTAPIATVSPQRQLNEVLDRELILFAKARIMAEWIDKNFSATFEQAFADATLRSRLDVSRDRVLLDKLRPFPGQKIPDRRSQLFTTDAVLQGLLKAPADIAGLWPIFDVLHHYGVVLLPPDPKNPFGRPSVLASITRVDARLERSRFDRETKAVEEKAVKFKKAVANKGVLHHAIESEVIPAEWSAGTKTQVLRVAKPLIQLMTRLRALNTTWRAGTYPGHWWNDFSLDMFIAAPLEKSGFWNRERMRAFFDALNTACTQDSAPGKFAWKGIYNDAGLAQEMDVLYGAGRVLSGVEGHGPGPRMHVHLDVRPLTVPFDDTTGFWLDGSRVVLAPPPLRPVVPGPTPAPIPVTPASRARETVDSETEDSGSGEAVPNGGKGRFRHAPLGGDGDNVEARFNVDSTIAAGSAIDVVVYLHGYGEPRTDFLAQKAKTAGVDLVDSNGTVKVRASRPTLVLIPRGRNTSASRWVFDALPNPAAFNALCEAGLTWLHRTVVRTPGAPFVPGRVTLMAHSGGGAGLSALLQNGLDPDEVVCFDSLYGGEDSIRRWAEARIKGAKAAESGLRAFYTGCSGPNPKFPAGRWVPKDGGGHKYEAPGSWVYWTTDNKWHMISTEVAARRLQHAIDRALGTDKALQPRFRVELTKVGHSDIPAKYSALLLNDIAANVPNATAAPPSTTRPLCVANDDWLTKLPQKPGGDDPPPAKP